MYKIEFAFENRVTRDMDYVLSVPGYPTKQEAIDAGDDYMEDSTVTGDSIVYDEVNAELSGTAYLYDLDLAPVRSRVVEEPVG